MRKKVLLIMIDALAARTTIPAMVAGRLPITRSGSIRFNRGIHGKQQARDDYDNDWTWQGELPAVDAVVNSAGRVQYGDYVNALQRIAGGICDVSGGLWVTARSGCEFCLAEASTHTGGSRGPLHIDDSTSPLIVAGLPDGLHVPVSPRTVDVAPNPRAGRFHDIGGTSRWSTWAK